MPAYLKKSNARLTLEDMGHSPNEQMMVSRSAGENLAAFFNGTAWVLVIPWILPLIAPFDTHHVLQKYLDMNGFFLLFLTGLVGSFMGIFAATLGRRAGMIAALVHLVLFLFVTSGGIGSYLHF